MQYTWATTQRPRATASPRPELARGSCRHGTRRVTCTLATVARALDRTTPAAAAAPTCRQPECAFVSVMETMEPRDGDITVITRQTVSNWPELPDFASGLTSKHFTQNYAEIMIIIYAKYSVLRN